MSYKTVNIDADVHKEFKVFCSKKDVKMVDELEKIIKKHIDGENKQEENEKTEKKSKYCNGNCSLCEYFAYTGKCALHTGE